MQSKRIFLLDDDILVFEYLKILAKQLPFHVELQHALTYEMAVTALKHDQFDFYILDYDLGEERTGLDFYQDQLKSRPMKVCFHTSSDKSLLGGLHDLYLPKPLTADNLIKALITKEKI